MTMKLVVLIFAVLATYQAIYQLQKWYVTNLVKVGGKPLLMFPASFSVPIHELSHLLVALLCFHKINEVKFFQVNGGGTLGYVNHSYKVSIFSPFQNMLIGLAPIAGGLIAIYALFYLFSPNAIPTPSQLQGHSMVVEGYSLLNPLSVLLNVLDLNGGDLSFWVVLVIAINIFVFSAPSNADFQGAGKGIVLTLLLLIGLSFSPYSHDIVNWLMVRFSAYIVPALVITAILLIPINLILYLLTKLKPSNKKQ